MSLLTQALIAGGSFVLAVIGLIAIGAWETRLADEEYDRERRRDEDEARLRAYERWMQ